MEFKDWWYEIGSGLAPKKDEDQEEHARRVAEMAWNAALEQGTRLDIK